MKVVINATSDVLNNNLRSQLHRLQVNQSNLKKRMPRLARQKTPVKKSMEEVYYTSGVDDQQVTKKHDTNATEGDDESFHSFTQDKLLEVATLYGEELQYHLVDNSTDKQGGDTEWADQGIGR